MGDKSLKNKAKIAKKAIKAKVKTRKKGKVDDQPMFPNQLRGN
jgi:hypothetical protein